MGEVELQPQKSTLIVHAVLFFYGDAANDSISAEIANDIATHWNEANGIVHIKNSVYRVVFDIEGIWSKSLTPEMVFENTNPRNNYFRIEEYASGNISFVDGINSNTGYFKLDNLLNNSTTAAHEFGHTIGLDHPEYLDIRGNGTPGIMYPRGTIVDPVYQYIPTAAPQTYGGTLNPIFRKVLQDDIALLRLHQLNFNKQGFSVLGNFSAIWHNRHIP